MTESAWRNKRFPVGSLKSKKVEHMGGEDKVILSLLIVLSDPLKGRHAWHWFAKKLKKLSFVDLDEILIRRGNPTTLFPKSQWRNISRISISFEKSNFG